MAFQVRFSDVAVNDLEKLRAVNRASILDDVERFLTVNPALESKMRVKRLREPAPAQFRLRVGDFRIFYDLEGKWVTILRVLHKSDTEQYLEDQP